MELIVDGVETYVYTGTRALEPGQPSWLFVHGAGMDHSVWVLQSRYFAFHGCNVLAVDLPGHGRSAGKPLDSIAAQADWLARLLTAAGIDRAVTVGHSMGSLAALELAVRHPVRVTALALAGTGFPMAVAEPLLTAAREELPRAVDMIVAWGHSPRSQLGGNRLPGMWITAEGRRLLERAGPGVLYADLKACDDYADGSASAVRVSCPVQFVLGRQDFMTPLRASRTLSRAMADSHTVLLDGCGHMPMIERPDETLDALIDLRDRLNCT